MLSIDKQLSDSSSLREGAVQNGPGFLSVVLLPAAHISGTMRCPEPLERIGHAGQLEVIGDVRVLGILVFAHTPIKPYIYLRERLMCALI